MRIVLQEKKSQPELSAQFIADLAASFQRVVVDTLSEKLFHAAEYFQAREVHLCGGVSANTALQTRISNMVQSRGYAYKAPVRKVYSTDNGAMIGARAYFQSRECLEKYHSSTILLPNPALQFV